jgi:TonB family protein
MVNGRRGFEPFLVATMILVMAGVSAAQRVAILTPNKTALDENVAAHLKSAFSDTLRVQDLEMSRAALDASGRFDNAFNLSLGDARQLAALVGSDFLILIKSGTQRRLAFDRPDYFESFVALYLLSGRSGRLIKWALVSKNGGSKKDAQQRAIQAAAEPDLVNPIRSAWKIEALETAPPRLEEIPDEGAPEAKGFRPPVPYRKFTPEYTRAAFLYDITATVEVMVDLDERGQITRTEISKWAGIGLDESVTAALRAMSWRPAERGGRPLPIRFLLRYNFKKIDKDD